MLPDVMAVYRKHKGGIWWQAGQNNSFYLRNGVAHIAFFKAIENHFNISQSGRIKKVFNKTFLAGLEDKRTDVIQKLAERFPDEYRDVVVSLKKKLRCNKKKRKKLLLLGGTILLCVFLICSFL